ncbi:MAG TPA: hypothetical protein VIH58_05860 [Chthoniobacterales bacterium]
MIESKAHHYPHGSGSRRAAAGSLIALEHEHHYYAQVVFLLTIE